MKFLVKLLPKQKGIPVLMYHHAGPVTMPEQAPFFIDEKTLAAQLDYLTKNGYIAISFADFERGQYLPKKPVLITFDDGWLDNYTAAFPVIKANEIQINIFLNTGFVGVNKDYMTWEHVEEMYKSGLVDFASHGVSHKRLRSLTDQEVMYELTASKTLLEQKLGKQIKSFCYPYGAVDKRIRALTLQAGYTVDYGTRRGICPWPWNGKEPVKRAHVMAGETLEDFKLELTRGRCKL